MTTPASTTDTTTVSPPGSTPGSTTASTTASTPDSTSRADAAPGRRSPDLRAGVRRAASLTRTGVDRLRALLGQIVWSACLLAAAALLLGAVLVVLEANTRNALVEGVLHAADWADLGVFSRTAGVKQFTGEGAAVRNALVNWGLGAVAWLVVGRVVRRVLTP